MAQMSGREGERAGVQQHATVTYAGKPTDRLIRGTVLAEAQAWLGWGTPSKDEQSKQSDHAMDALRSALYGELAAVVRTEAELVELRRWVDGQ